MAAPSACEGILDLVAGGALGALQSGRSSFSYPMDMSAGDHRIDERGAGALFDIGIYCIAPFLLMARRDPIALAATATRNDRGVDVVMSGWINWGARLRLLVRRVVRCAGAQGDGGLPAVRDSSTCPDFTCPALRMTSVVTVERRDGTVDSIHCVGANAYAGMVSHFEAVATNGAPPIFGRTESMRLANILDELHRLTAA